LNLWKRGSRIFSPRKSRKEPETLDQFLSSIHQPTDPSLLSSRDIEKVESAVGEEKFLDLFQKQWESENPEEKQKALVYFQISSSTHQAKFFSRPLKRETSFLNLVKKDNQSNFYSIMPLLERLYLINDLILKKKGMDHSERTRVIRKVDESFQNVDSIKLFETLLDAIDSNEAFQPVDVFKHLSLNNQLKLIKPFYECGFNQMILVFKTQLTRQLKKKNNKVFERLSNHFSSLGNVVFLNIFEMFDLKLQLKAIDYFDDTIFLLVRQSFINRFNIETAEHTDLQYFEVIQLFEGLRVKERLRDMADEIENSSFKDAILIEEEMNRKFLVKLNQCRHPREIGIFVSEISKSHYMVNSLLLYFLKQVKDNPGNRALFLRVLLFAEKYLNQRRDKLFSLQRILNSLLHVESGESLIERKKKSLSLLMSLIRGFYFSKDFFEMIKKGGKENWEDIIYSYSRYLITHTLIKNFSEFFCFDRVREDERYQLLGFLIRWVELIDLKEIDDEVREYLLKIIRHARRDPEKNIKRRGRRLESRLKDAAAREMKEYISSPKRADGLEKYQIEHFLLSKNRERYEQQMIEIMNDLQIWSQTVFSSVEPLEFIGCPWMHAEVYGSICPGILKLVRGYDRITHHMARLILGGSNDKEKKRLYDFFMKIAQKLFSEGNLYVAGGIFLGLNIPMVIRTFKSHTRSQIDREYYELAEMFSSDGNLKNLRNYIKDLERKPGHLILPPISLVLSDHLHADENIPDYDDVHVNRYKVREVGKLLRDFKRCQETIPRRRPVYQTNISQLLFEKEALKEDDLWKMSYEQVPTSRTSSYES